MRSLRRALFLSCVLGLLAALCSCSAPAKQPEKQGKEYYLYFDTVSYVYSYAGDSGETFAANCAVVEDTLKTYHQLFDIYNEYEGINNLCTVNRLAGGAPVEVDEKLIDFLLYAKELHEKTNGDEDPPHFARPERAVQRSLPAQDIRRSELFRDRRTV